MPEKEVIRLELRRVQREIAGLGRCTFRAASIGLEEDLCWHYDRPLRANYRQFCSELIAGCLQEPELSAESIDRLPERTRSGLRAGVVAACELDSDLRRLRGTSLGPDERLFAAMMWHYEEWAARMGELIVGFGLAVSNDLSRIVQNIVRPQLQKVQSGVSNILRASGLFRGMTYLTHLL